MKPIDFYSAFLKPTTVEFKDGTMKTLPPTVDAAGRVTYHAEFTQTLPALPPKGPVSRQAKELLALIEKDVIDKR